MLVSRVYMVYVWLKRDFVKIAGRFVFRFGGTLSQFHLYICAQTMCSELLPCVDVCQLISQDCTVSCRVQSWQSIS